MNASRRDRERGTASPGRYGPKPTVRAAGLTVVGDRVLLVRQNRSGIHYWLLPGGGVDFGESLAEALAREYREELALQVAPGEPVALVEAISDDMERYAKHVLHVVLMAPLPEDAPQPRLGGDPRVLEARFFDADELASLSIAPPITDFLLDALAAQPSAVTYLGVRW